MLAIAISEAKEANVEDAEITMAVKVLKSLLLEKAISERDIPSIVSALEEAKAVGLDEGDASLNISENRENGASLMKTPATIIFMRTWDPSFLT